MNLAYEIDQPPAGAGTAPLRTAEHFSSCAVQSRPGTGRFRGRYVARDFSPAISGARWCARGKWNSRRRGDELAVGVIQQGAGGERDQPGRLPRDRTARRARKVTRDAVVIRGRPVVSSRRGGQRMLTFVVKYEARIAIILVDAVDDRPERSHAQRQQQRPRGGAEQPRREAQHPSHDKERIDLD
jgi:hypothetical protein